MTKRRIHAEPRRWWTKADDRELRRLYPHQPTADVAKLIGRSLPATYGRAGTLGLAKTAAYLASPAAHRLDGVKGMGSRFPKGHVPANKGLRRPGWHRGRMKETQFKKGGRSPRWPVEDYPIGALRINTDGQIDIKFREGLRAWHSLARWTWITERGPIPKGGVIRPINGDQHDTRIENLRLTTRGELMRENTYRRYPKAIGRLIQLRGALQRQINRREKERADHA
jgi:hypothetical protein